MFPRKLVATHFFIRKRLYWTDTSSFWAKCLEITLFSLYKRDTFNHFHIRTDVLLLGLIYKKKNLKNPNHLPETHLQLLPVLPSFFLHITYQTQDKHNNCNWYYFPVCTLLYLLLLQIYLYTFLSFFIVTLFFSSLLSVYF